MTRGVSVGEGQGGGQGRGAVGSVNQGILGLPRPGPNAHLSRVGLSVPPLGAAGSCPNGSLTSTSFVLAPPVLITYLARMASAFPPIAT